jgi:hypothetical protein
MIIDSPVISGSLAASFKNVAITGSLGVTGSITTTGTITAQTLVVQTITSSVIYSSGSNVFGNNIANTQTFTGSVYITGSIGVGTNLPLALLHLSSSTSTAAYIHSTGTANYASLNLTNNTTGYGYDVGMGGSTSIAPNCFYIYGGATASVKLAVASGGNVGIGTVIPSASLEVNGKVYVGGNTSNSNYQFLVKRGTDRNMGIGLQGTDLSIEFVNDIYTANVPTRIYANPLVLLGGNVGVGVNDPQSKFDVTNVVATAYDASNTLTSGQTMRIANTSTTSGVSANLLFIATGAGGGNGLGSISGVNTGVGSLALTFATRDSGGNVTERMRITSGGTVSINTASGPIDSSNQKLQIYGSIRQDVIGTSYGEGMIMNFPADGTNYGGLFFHQTSTALAAVGGSSIKWGINYNYIPEIGVGSGALCFVQANTNTRMMITSVGCVLLGTTTDVNNVRLQVAASGGVGSWISGTFAGPGGTDKVVLGNLAGYAGASIGAHNSALSAWAQLNINPGGGAVYAGTVRLDTLSDQRVKDNIQPISGSLNKVLQLNGKKFHLKDEPEDKIRYGFIAQDLEGILDEFVINSSRTFTKDDLVVENVKSIENWASSWAALLVEAVKELKAQNDSLQSQIDELKNK